MSPLMCLLFFLVLTPMGVVMAGVSWPMIRANAGPAHRAPRTGRWAPWSPGRAG